MSQKTYGEFLDAILARAKDHNDHAGFFIKMRVKEQHTAGADGMRTVPLPEWTALLAQPLTKEVVLGFASAIRDDFRRGLSETSDRYMYNDLMKDGHAFQEDVQLLACEFGIDVRLVDVDAPLSPSDALVQAGVLKVVAKSEE
jgi:hypothetical protein